MDEFEAHFGMLESEPTMADYLDLRKAKFWEALQQLCTLYGIVLMIPVLVAACTLCVMLIKAA